MKLLGTSNPKTVKGEALGFLTAIMHLAPATLAKVFTRRGNLRTMCAKASPGCAAVCLNSAGRGRMDRVQEARIRKTRLFWADLPRFVALLEDDIRAHVRKALRERLTPAVRLNGTSDVLWERVAPEIFETFPDVQFYDYTKIPGRVTPGNYHLTFSRSETNDVECAAELAGGRNVAAVFAPSATLAEGLTWAMERYGDHAQRIVAFSMDDTDLRFLDPPGPGIGMLLAKGDAKRDTSGFVVPSPLPATIERCRA